MAQQKICLTFLLGLLSLLLGIPAFAKPTFPVMHSADRHYLVDQRNIPFPVLGRTAWFVLALNVADYRIFVDDTAARGYNAIELHVLNHDPRGNSPPFNGNGDAPFRRRIDGTPWNGSLHYDAIATGAPDFTTPNNSYWRFVDRFLIYCESKGILVLMFPAYVGYQGGNQGWLREMEANGPAKIQEYGAWIAARFRNRRNIVWMLGGDMGTPPNNFSDEQTNVERALLRGLLSVPGQKSTLISAEWSSGSIATDQTIFGSFMSLNAVYDWGGHVIGIGRRAYARTPKIPAFLLEEPYDEEGPDGTNVNHSATQPVRRFQWWGWLSTIGGYVSGNGYLWPFEARWKDHLNSQNSRNMAILNNFIQSLSWYELVPCDLSEEHAPIIAENSNANADDYIAAAASPNGTLLIAYVPPAHAGPIGVDMKTFEGAKRARWFDPTNGEYANIDNNIPSGDIRWFNTPGKNSAGQTDWVLVIDSTASKSKHE